MLYLRMFLKKLPVNSKTMLILLWQTAREKTLNHMRKRINLAF